MSVSEELYLVEQVRGKRRSLKKLGGVEYFVKWVGFDSSHNTWEPAEHLEACAGLVEQFEEELQKREQDKGKARKRWSEMGEEIVIPLSDELKAVLVDDFDYIGRQRKLLHVPSRYTVDDLINSYYQARKEVEGKE